MSDMRTAYHEAGHALIALALRLPVALVTIDRDGQALGSVTLDKPANDSRTPLVHSLTPEQRARIGVWDVAWSVAGIIAEQIAFGSEDAGCERDRRHAEIAAERTDDAAGTMAWQWRRQTHEAVERHLRANWRAVTTLALALLDERTMTGAQVREAIGDVSALDLSSAEGAVRYWSAREKARERSQSKATA